MAHGNNTVASYRFRECVRETCILGTQCLACKTIHLLTQINDFSDISSFVST